MKYSLISLLILVLSIPLSPVLSQADSEPEALGLPGDNLDLYAVLDLFQKSKTIEDFEKDLNLEKTGVNNLDLDLDGKVDFIKVETKQDKDDFTFILQVAVSEKEIQDVAVILVSKDDKGDISMQIVGDKDLYGKDYIIEPQSKGVTANPGYTGDDPVTENVPAATQTVVVQSTPIVQYVYSPAYVPYYPPYYYGYYPPYYAAFTVMAFSIYASNHYYYHGGGYGYGHTTVIHNHNNYNNYNINRNNSNTVSNNMDRGSYGSNQAGTRPSTGTSPSTRPSAGTGAATRPSTGAGTKPSTGAGASTRPSTGASAGTKPSTGASTRPSAGASASSRPSTSASSRPSTSPSTRPTTSASARPSSSSSMGASRTMHSSSAASRSSYSGGGASRGGYSGGGGRRR